MNSLARMYLAGSLLIATGTAGVIKYAVPDESKAGIIREFDPIFANSSDRNTDAALMLVSGALIPTGYALILYAMMKRDQNKGAGK